MTNIARSALFLYIQNMLGAGAGYAFWVIISRLTGPETVGLASTTAAIAGVATGFAALGVPRGLQRFLGKAISNNDAFEFRRYLRAAIIVIGLSVIGVASLLFMISSLFSSYINLPYEFLIVAIIMLIASALTSILTGAFIAALSTRVLLVAQTLASSLRIVSGIVFVILGMGALGVALSYSILEIVLLIVLSLSMVQYLSTIIVEKKSWATKHVIKELLEAGLVNWIPSIVYTVGMQIGVIVVFGVYGAFEAGLYFIALAISSIITGIYSSIMRIAFPLLSGMKDGRKKAAWRTVKLSLVFSIPLSIAAITYPRIVLGVFGSEYGAADLTLIVLLLSTIPLSISTGVYTLCYAYGNYREVFAIGLAGNIPTLILYFMLTPSFGGLGAAYAYLGGALTGFTVSAIMAHRINMRIIWADLVKVSSIPLAVSSFAYITNIHWLIGGSSILLFSILGYAKLNLLTKQDLSDLVEAILPKKLTESIYQRMALLIKFLYSD